MARLRTSSGRLRLGPPHSATAGGRVDPPDPDVGVALLIPDPSDEGTFLIGDTTKVTEDSGDEGTYLLQSDTVTESGVDVGTFIAGPFQ
jgi:hypothetical protein